MPICENKGRSAMPKKAVNYICDVEKSGGIVTTYCTDVKNITGAEIEKAFKEIWDLHNKNMRYDSRKYYHFIISFEAKDDYRNGGPITPEAAVEIGERVLNKLYPNHQFIGAAGTDTNKIHFHAIVNSIDMETGKALHRTFKDIAREKDVTNEIAQELYGVEPFDWEAAVDAKHERIMNGKKDDKPEKALSNEEIEMQKRLSEEELEAYSWKERIRNAISNAAQNSISRENFEWYLKEIYDIEMTRNTGKTVTFSCAVNGKTKKVRGEKLGAFYTADCIDYWINYNKERSENKEIWKMDFQAPIHPIVVRKEEKKAKNYKIGLYDNGRKRTTIELLFLLASTIIKNSEKYNKETPTNSSAIRIQNSEGKHVYAPTDWKLQNMYDAIVEVNNSGFENAGDIFKKYDEVSNTLMTLRRQEKGLKTSLKKMETISDLINDYRNAVSESERADARAKLHKKNIHNENDISDFENRKTDIEEHLSDLQKQIGEQWRETKKLQRLIKNVELAQSPVYCLNRNFEIRSPESIDYIRSEVKKKQKQPELVEQPEPVEQPEYNTMEFSIDDIIGNAELRAQRSEYEKLLIENGIVKENDEETRGHS